MRVVVQRVNQGSVDIAGRERNTIQEGLVVLAGFEEEDNNEDLEWIAGKLPNLRIFNDEEGKMNLSVKDVDGEILLVSQFTLHAGTKKGNRPSFTKAAKPVTATPLYEKFIKMLSIQLGKTVKTGEFGAYMKVSLENDGPVTIIMDSRNRE